MSKIRANLLIWLCTLSLLTYIINEESSFFFIISALFITSLLFSLLSSVVFLTKSFFLSTFLLSSAAACSPILFYPRNKDSKSYKSYNLIRWSLNPRGGNFLPAIWQPRSQKHLNFFIQLFSQTYCSCISCNPYIHHAVSTGGRPRHTQLCINCRSRHTQFCIK